MNQENNQEIKMIEENIPKKNKTPQNKQELIKLNNKFIAYLYTLNSKLYTLNSKLKQYTPRIINKRAYYYIQKSFNNSFKSYDTSYKTLKRLLSNTNITLKLYIKTLKNYLCNNSIHDKFNFYYSKYNHHYIFYSYRLLKNNIKHYKKFQSYKNKFRIEGYFKSILNNLEKLIKIMVLNPKYNLDSLLRHADPYHDLFKLKYMCHCLKRSSLIKLFTKVNYPGVNYLFQCDFKYPIVRYLLPYLTPKDLNIFILKKLDNSDYIEKINKNLNVNEYKDINIFINYIKDKDYNHVNLIFNFLFVDNNIENININNKSIIKILYYLIKNQFKDKALYLLDKYPNLQDDNPNIQETLLYAAVYINDTDIVKILINKDFKYKYPKTEFKNSILSIAMNNKNQNISMILIKNGHCYDYPKCDFSETALKCALQNKLYKVVEFMINNNVKLNYPKNNFKNTPLSYAIHTRNENLIEKIINKNVKIDYPNLIFEKTPLYKSIIHKLINISLLLINKGVRINYRKVDFIRTPLYYSIKNILEPVSLLLIDKGVKIRYYNILNDKKTPLGIAEYYGPPSIVKTLIEKGCLKDILNIINK